MAPLLLHETDEATLGMLRDALNAIDVGIALFDRDMRLRYYSRRLAAIFRLPRDRSAVGWTLGEMLTHVAANRVLAGAVTKAPDFAARQEATIRAGPIAPAEVDLSDGSRLLFTCAAFGDGGRVLTYVDISRQLKCEADEAVEQISAEMRFSNETLQEQAASLAALAEAADESAHAAELARCELEREIAERRQLEAQLRRMATTDGLTGALNRAALLAAGQLAVEQERHDGRGLAVLMLDVDHFKAINDRYGHAGGDLALRDLVEALRSESRPGDLLGRLGGEEFAVVLAGVTLQVAERVAERLRMRVAAGRLGYLSHVIEMTVSIGVAMQQAADRSIEPIISRADAALYEAKHRGRNQVVLEEASMAA